MKKILLSSFIILLLSMIVTPICSADLLEWDKMSNIVSPTKLQKVDGLPVQITTQLNTKANPGTFKAWLNGKEITAKFKDVASGKTALIDTSDGLRVGSSDSKLLDQANILMTEVRGFKKKEIDVDIRTFFVKVEAAKTIGPEGGTIEVTDPASPIYGLKIEISQDSLITPQIITISKADRLLDIPDSIEFAGTWVKLGPDRLTFSNPVLVTLPYDDENNDGIIDGVYQPEENIKVIHLSDSGVIQYMDILGQDYLLNTVTFLTDHFSTFGTAVTSCPVQVTYTMDSETADQDGDGQSDWVYFVHDPPPPNKQAQFGYLFDGMTSANIWTRPYTSDRVKLHTNKYFGDGIYTWRVYIPAMGEYESTSVGAFLYNDRGYEIDFECGYGMQIDRRLAGATSSNELICHMTSHHPFPNSVNVRIPQKITANQWYTFKISVNKNSTGGGSTLTWKIGSQTVATYPVDYEDEKFQIHCSVENLLNFMGEQLPYRENHAYFDYVRFTPLGTCEQPLAISFTPNPISPVWETDRWEWHFNFNVSNPNSFPIEVLAFGQFNECLTDIDYCSWGPEEFVAWFKDCGSGSIYVPANGNACEQHYRIWRYSTPTSNIIGRYALWYKDGSGNTQVTVSPYLTLLKP